MKRKIGIFALTVAGISFVTMILMQVYGHCKSADMVPFVLLFLAGGITAATCLSADAIRFIGKCFSQGFSAGNSQGCSQVCPLCGKAISGNARFCSECGCELTEKH